MSSTILGETIKPDQMTVSPETLGGYFEGDIELTPSHIRALLYKSRFRESSLKWTSKVVPYQFNGDHSKFWFFFKLNFIQF